MEPSFMTWLGSFLFMMLAWGAMAYWSGELLPRALGDIFNVITTSQYHHNPFQMREQ